MVMLNPRKPPIKTFSNAIGNAIGYFLVFISALFL